MPPASDEELAHLRLNRPIGSAGPSGVREVGTALSVRGAAATTVLSYWKGRTSTARMQAAEARFAIAST